jgi:hypothetical protein
MARIDTPAFGRACKHMQTFDLDAYLHVNSTILCLATRWKCPVCSSLIRPEDIVVDPLARRLLAATEADAVRIEPDGTIVTVGSLQDEDENDDEEDEEQEPRPALAVPIVMTVDDD